MTEERHRHLHAPSAAEVHAELRKLKVMLHTLRRKEMELVRRLIARAEPVPEVLSGAADRLAKTDLARKRLKSA